MPNPSTSATSESTSFDNEQRIAALRSIGELEGLTTEELQWIANAGTERLVHDGELIFSQQDPPHHLIFILSGEVVIKRHTSSPVTVLTGRTGRITGKTPFTRSGSWNADGRATGDVRLLEVHESQFPSLLSAIPSMTERIVRVLLNRNRSYTRAEEQIGKLSALSKLAGNLAHELNNPASAARSAAVALKQTSGAAGSDARYRLGLKFADERAVDTYLKGLNHIRAKVASGSRQTDPMLAGDLEEVLSDWLASKGFAQGWKLAPFLAEAEVPIAELEAFLASVPPGLETVALQDLMATVSQDANMASIVEASERIFRIVAAVKDYSYMDQDLRQEVEIAKALDDVLMMFQSRLHNVEIRKNFAPGLPRIHGYGSELNQAFGALIENSLDAMEDEGTLTLSARQQGNTILIDVADDGRGIPEEVQGRVFEPFFTTKPIGKGLGLGLDTVQRVAAEHFGAVGFDTSPQGTTFHLRLPIDRVGIY
jgi:signal transduction histidine kinase